MTKDLLLSLYDYGEWANQRLLGEAAKLSPQELSGRTSQGYESVHQTFVHLLSADFRWLLRWQNQALPPPLTAADAPSLDAVRARWATIGAERRAYLTSLSEADLAEPLDLPMGTIPRWQGILHCANHGTQHRSEIAAMLTDAGHSPGDLDYLVFCRVPR